MRIGQYGPLCENADANSDTNEPFILFLAFLTAKRNKSEWWMT